MKNFIEEYLDYFSDTEVPTLFDRWACLSGIGTILERNSYLLHGTKKIYTNQYVMLVGDSGSRKSTAIDRIQTLLKAVEYKTFAAEKTTKEKWLLDLQEGLDKIGTVDHALDITKGTKNPTMQALFPTLELNTEPVQCCITAEEWNAFFGHGNVEFYDLLTKLWDFKDLYSNRIKSGQSVNIPNPTINILGGNTTIGITQAFPTEVIGAGFFSRLVMVYSDPTNLKITWPKEDDGQGYSRDLQKKLLEIRTKIKGKYEIDANAKNALDEIYQEWKPLGDIRFKSYSERRLTHLFKMIQIVAAASLAKVITVEHVIYANTILHYTEFMMPKALGEFGKAKNSDVNAKILELVERTEKPIHLNEIWQHVNRDLDNMKQLVQIMIGLKEAGKIDSIRDGFFPKKAVPKFEQKYCEIGLLREYSKFTGDLK